MRLCDGREFACWGLDGEVVERTKECYASFGLREDGDWGYRGAKIATKTMNGT